MGKSELFDKVVVTVENSFGESAFNTVKEACERIGKHPEDLDVEDIPLLATRLESQFNQFIANLLLATRTTRT